MHLFCSIVLVFNQVNDDFDSFYTGKKLAEQRKISNEKNLTTSQIQKSKKKSVFNCCYKLVQTNEGETGCTKKVKDGINFYLERNDF